MASSAQQIAKKRTKQVPTTAWQTYQAAVLARTDLTPNLRLLFRELASRGNYEDGGGCAPKLGDVAARCGWTRQWAARQLRRLGALGIIRTIPLRTRGGRWNRNAYQFIGHGFASPDGFDNLKWLRPSAAARGGNQVHERSTGRFTNGPKVTTGNGPKVTTGRDTNGPIVTNQTLQLTTDSAPESAASATALMETKKPTEPTTSEAFEQWLRGIEGQFDEYVVAPSIPRGV